MACLIETLFPTVVVKPGTCPSMESMMGSCAEMCDSDSSCEGEHKCCSNGCGRSCMAPAGNLANFFKYLVNIKY